MDWLRSEDLKEEKNVTAPVVSIAVETPSRVGKHSFESFPSLTITRVGLSGTRKCFL
jgi:hypothetical protein